MLENTRLQDPSQAQAAAPRQVSPLAIRLAVAATLGLMQFQQSAFASGTGLNVDGITTWVCNFAKLLSGPGLVLAAAIVIIVIYGWNMIFGDGNAFSGLKRGIIGVIIIMSAATLVTSIFGQSANCQAGAPRGQSIQVVDFNLTA